MCESWANKSKMYQLVSCDSSSLLTRSLTRPYYRQIADCKEETRQHVTIVWLPLLIYQVNHSVSPPGKATAVFSCFSSTPPFLPCCDAALWMNLQKTCIMEVSIKERAKHSFQVAEKKWKKTTTHISCIIKYEHSFSRTTSSAVWSYYPGLCESCLNAV